MSGKEQDAFYHSVKLEGGPGFKLHLLGRTVRGDDAVALLRENAHDTMVTLVRFDECDLSAKAAVAAVEATFASDIVLDETPLEDAASFSRALQHNPHVRSVQVINTPLSAEAARGIAAACAEGNMVTSLDLSNCGLGDAGAREVCGAVSGGRVKTLALNGNGITDARAYLGTCSGVTKLYLINNPCCSGAKQATVVRGETEVVFR